eukprot:521842_1
MPCRQKISQSSRSFLNSARMDDFMQRKRIIPKSPVSIRERRTSNLGESCAPNFPTVGQLMRTSSDFTRSCGAISPRGVWSCACVNFDLITVNENAFARLEDGSDSSLVLEQEKLRPHVALPTEPRTRPHA